MPTGYTSDVQDGKVTDFRTFALSCSRAMGACIMQRDDPMGDLPAMRVVSDYPRKYLKEAEEKVALYARMSVEEAAAEQAAMLRQRTKDCIKEKESRHETRGRYEAMLAKVREWKPPTKEHDGLRDFMIQQLEESIKFDCSDSPYYNPPAPLAAEVYLAERRGNALEDFNRAKKSLQEEEERVASQNAWVTALYKSLSTKVPPAARAKGKRR